MENYINCIMGNKDISNSEDILVKTDINNLIYADSKFLALADQNILTSTDAITWSVFPTQTNWTQNTLIYGSGNLYYAATSSAARFSKDGIVWGELFTYTSANASAVGRGLVTEGNDIAMGWQTSGLTVVGKRTLFTYDTTTQFALPNQRFTTTTTTGDALFGVLRLNQASLFIKS
jgi:hypothetical protein